MCILYTRAQYILMQVKFKYLGTQQVKIMWPVLLFYLFIFNKYQYFTISHSVNSKYSE